MSRFSRSPRLNRWLASAVLVVCCTSVALAATPPLDYPLAPNTQWTFHFRQELGPGVHFGPDRAKLARGNVLDATVVSRVAGSETLGGLACTRVESRLAGTLWLTEWLRLGPQGLLMGKTLDSETGQEIPMDPPQKLLSPTLEPGETRSWQANDEPLTIHTRVVGPANVVVLAGTYHAQQIATDTVVGGAPIEIQQTRWFVPGVGYVKQETQVSAAGHFLWHVALTLEKFEPGAATAAKHQ